MANNTFVDEFGNTYIAPYIPNKIVGFSGIDPVLVSTGSGNNSASGDGTISSTDTAGRVYGNGSGGEGEEALPISHEELDNLLGGDEFEHYHLNEADYDTLIEFLAERRAAEENGEVYYTLNEEEYERFIQMLDDLYPDWNSDEEQSRYTLSENEYERLNNLFEAVYPDEESNEPVFPANIDEDALNALIDARMEAYFTNNPIQSNEALNELIDARIAANLANKCGCCSNNNQNNP